MRDEGKDKEREKLIAAIEAEFADILAREHGMAGVHVRLDRETGDIVSSLAVPDELKSSIFAVAVKRAISKRVRAVEDGAD